MLTRGLVGQRPARPAAILNLDPFDQRPRTQRPDAVRNNTGADAGRNNTGVATLITTDGIYPLNQNLIECRGGQTFKHNFILFGACLAYFVVFFAHVC